MLLSANQVSGKSFDYIVIGGGTSGLTVAARLSEDPSISVLVIEAGQANLNDPEILTPGGFGKRFGNVQYDWAFRTTPQEACHQRSFTFNRGKGLGGSSALNFHQYHRPTKADIDAFEELGNLGWNWGLLEHYYAKTEGFLQPTEKTDAISFDLAHHGITVRGLTLLDGALIEVWLGPLVVAYQTTLSGFELPYQLAMKNLGISPVEEPFSGDTAGTWLTPLTIDPQERVRSYSANKYYQPNGSRTNLTVVVSAHVAEIVTELDLNGCATAIEVVFISNEVRHSVKVGNEVILSAGAIMSPQILELSGIGDIAILQAAGVQTRVRLPGVGKNVQEHTNARVTRELRPEIASEYLTFDMLSDATEYDCQRELYQTSGTGVFATGSSTCMTFVPLESISPIPDILQKSIIQSIDDSVSSTQISLALKKQYEIQLKHLRDGEPTCEFILSPRLVPGLNPPPGKQYITASGFINHPFSRGSIHIASSDPMVQPNIDPNYFEHEYDLLQLVEHIKFCRKILDQEPLKKLLTEIEVAPGPHVQTDEQIADYVKSTMGTTWHTVGSCSMLPLADDGVVDRKLKVYNTSNIRVVDISIIPLHIGAHLQATAYAIGELGADIIKRNIF
ncbi:alcohol oxidase [Mycena metata]|uniref:Alcohol oxidase n=1 Tax=Mycena metata TaxID=1033252 RepID=A0AAD7NV34_9AGAR|nr:alcohol oxidase [Mycena metata]